jgi:hypothetical protein
MSSHELQGLSIVDLAELRRAQIRGDGHRAHWARWRRGQRERKAREAREALEASGQLALPKSGEAEADG